MHRSARLGRLANTLCEQRMVFAQIGAHNQHTLQCAQGRDRHSQIAHAVGRCEVGIAQAVVNVLATQSAYQLPCKMQFFQRTVRAHQRTDGACTMVGLDFFQAIGHVFQGRLPINIHPLATMLDHGRGQTVGRIERFIRKTVAVSNPALVHRFVFEGDDAQNLVIFDLNNQVGTGGIVRADGFAAGELPSAGAVTEGFAGQRSYGANVDHVAGELGVNGLTQEGFDFGVLAAVGHAQLHDARNFLPEAHAAGAMDTAAHLLHADQRSDIFDRHHAFLFGIARTGTAVAHGQILQLALATLITNRAIQRVIDQQELHHRFLGFDGLVGLGVHDHALRHRSGAGGHGLRSFFYVNQAHAAIGGDAELLVVAEVGDVGARLLGRMHDHAAFQDFYFFAVEFDFNHGVMPIKRKRRPRRSCALRGKQIHRGSA